MTDPSALPCILIVADPDRVGELVAALSELPGVEVVVSSGGDDTIDLFAARRPAVVVLTASLQQGDAKSLIVTLRGRVPRAEVAIVVIGDDAGPVRTALDALDLAPDRFVTRPLSPRALRFAVTGGIEAVRLARGSSRPPPPPPRPVAMGTAPGALDSQPGGTPRPRLPRLPSVTAAQPPSLGASRQAGPPPSPPSLPVSRAAPLPSVASSSAGSPPPWLAGPPGSPVSSLSSSLSSSPGAPAPSTQAPAMSAEDAGGGPEVATRAALRARWEALADSMADLPGDDGADAPAPLLPPPLAREQRARQDEPVDELAPPVAWNPGSTDEIAPPREPTLILSEPALAQEPAAIRTRAGEGHVVVAARTSSEDLWSEAKPIRALVDREAKAGAEPEVVPDPDAPDTLDALDVAVEDVSGDLLGDLADRRASFPGPADAMAEPPDLLPPDLLSPDLLPPDLPSPDLPLPDLLPPGATAGGPEPRDFARELRAKMSVMAQRLFQGDAAPVSSPADHAPRHDHHTEIDLATLGDDPPLAGMIDLEAGSAQRAEPRDLAPPPGSSGSWDTQVRERGLADSGAIARGVSDAAMLLAKMFAQSTTGRIGFRRDEVETIVYFDHGRPVFASSNEPRDRMGELLVREGKITAAQYERCQAVVAESGRRMGEILVDFGFLKRRELLPAVRRHVEDLVYSLFGWERGTYAITRDREPSAERIRLSRHPAALILEGIRRKLDRASLERLIGPPSTVIEVRDRDRLGGIVHMGDLTAEERRALAAFDGQADLAQVAHIAGVDIADVLPLAWGLGVLGLATARRTDTETSDETTALVGETDLAIDRERVRARWQLVTEADYFALLGVRRDATGFEIRRAYQSARRDFAADCFPSDLRRELARELDDIANVLDEAFRVLRDDRLRQTYLANLIDR